MHIVPALALLTKIKIMYFKCKLFTCLSSASVLSSSTLPCHLNVPGHREGGLDCMPATIIREKSRNQERRNWNFCHVLVLVILYSSSPQSKIKGHKWHKENQLEFENLNCSQVCRQTSQKQCDLIILVYHENDVASIWRFSKSLKEIRVSLWNIS